MPQDICSDTELKDLFSSFLAYQRDSYNSHLKRQHGKMDIDVFCAVIQVWTKALESERENGGQTTTGRNDATHGKWDELSSLQQQILEAFAAPERLEELAHICHQMDRAGTSWVTEDEMALALRRFGVIGDAHSLRAGLEDCRAIVAIDNAGGRTIHTAISYCTDISC
jgi:hypothetical protein